MSEAKTDAIRHCIGVLGEKCQCKDCAKAIPDARAELAALVERIAALEAENADMVPRSRYNAACDDYVKLKSRLTEIQKNAHDEIERLEAENAKFERENAELKEKSISYKREKELTDAMCRSDEKMNYMHAIACKVTYEKAVAIEQARREGYELGYHTCSMDEYEDKDVNTTYDEAVKAEAATQKKLINMCKPINGYHQVNAAAKSSEKELEK